MPAKESEEKAKVDKPTPFMVYLISMIIGFAVLVPGFTGLMYLIKVHQWVDGQSLEFDVLLGLIVGVVACIIFGIVFGDFANKQIIDMKD